MDGHYKGYGFGKMEYITPKRKQKWKSKVDFSKVRERVFFLLAPEGQEKQHGSVKTIPTPEF